MMTNKNIFSYFSGCGKMILAQSIFVLLLTLLFCSNAFAIDEEFLEYCVGSVFDEKYASTDCWSCDIVKILMRSMMNVTEALFNAVQELCLLILQLGAALWLAIYLMKSLSSFAAQDPAKVLDGMIAFMFKWVIIYSLIAGGLEVIMEYVVNPLLSIGFDIGTEFATGSALSLF